MADDAIASEILAQFTNTPYDCTSLSKLSGGTGNFVYRGSLQHPLSDGTETVVFKHAKDYLASNREFKLSPERCLIEENALRSLNSFPEVTDTNGAGESHHITVRTPHLLTSRPETFTLVLECLPNATDLKSLLVASPDALSHPHASAIGRALGTWLGAFHAWSAAPAQTALATQLEKNHLMRDLKFSINYDSIVRMVDERPGLLGESRAVFEQVRDMAAAEVGRTAGEGLGPIHGDFWSGNILLPKSTSTTTTLLITDWELTHVGPRALDLGQMLAEIYMLKYFKNIDAGEWIARAFIEAYPDLSEDMAFRTLIHVGVHFVFWGSVVPGWGDAGQVEGVVRLGRDLIVNAWGRERGFFEGALWECLFRS
ncbi:kinase-like domain-containing protein [Aspergillus taichungensis]|uniref:Kinase-like domain-containing protein n=1 Tax=Aspergillus taichungensis TaxID=482145 RepID=A0A2J5I4F1_9EURO|nr:kinase-like domain-containing protein [Aspergillus taichungensis]